MIFKHCFKDEVLQKMCEEYLPSQSKLAIESAISSRPYGRVAGLYRLMNLQMEQRRKVDNDDVEVKGKISSVSTSFVQESIYPDEKDEFVKPTIMKKKVVRFDGIV